MSRPFALARAAAPAPLGRTPSALESASASNDGNRFLDALFIAAQHDDCGLAADLIETGGLCRATRARDVEPADSGRAPSRSFARIFPMDKHHMNV